MREWLTSKKTKHAIAALIVAVVAKAGFDLDVETVLALISPFLTAIASQGVADIGKETAKVYSASPQIEEAPSAIGFEGSNDDEEVDEIDVGRAYGWRRRDDDIDGLGLGARLPVDPTTPPHVQPIWIGDPISGPTTTWDSVIRARVTYTADSPVSMCFEAPGNSSRLPGDTV